MAGRKAKLTKRLVEQLVADGPDEIWVWDMELPGFALRIKPSGIKAYVVQYRNAHRRPRKITLGRHGVMTVDEARRLARKTLAMIDRGEDPAEQRRANRNAVTVAELCDRYLAEHVDVHNKPTTRRQMRRLVEIKIRPALGQMPIKSVTRADIASLHSRMSNSRYEANRMLAALSKMFNLAELWGLRPDGSNPCRHIKRYAETKRDRFLDDDELTRLGDALTTIETEEPHLRPAITVIRMLAFTGCRCSEVLNLQWGYIDFGQGVIRLPDAKAGARTVPLAAAALAVLASLPAGPPEARVWIDVVTGQPLTYWQLGKVWQKARKRAGLEEIRMHDLRHTMGTYAGQSGLNAFIVRDLLGHKTLAMTGRYVSKHIDPLRAAADHVVGRISAALSGSSDQAGNVFPLRSNQA